ncbi:MAG: LysE family transporter [Anaerolineae bacterium]|nr:LysE family transporter [Anaerolineae bacterium]
MIYLMKGFTLGFSAGVSPGPFHAFLFAQAMKNGWRRAVPAAFAPLLSDGPIIVLVLIVLTQMPDGVRRALQIVGGLFILYLAREAYRTFRHPPDDLSSDEGAAWDSLRKAVIVNLLNPNPYIFWTVAGGPMLLEAWEKASHYGAGFLVAFYVAMIGIFALLAALFSMAGGLGPKVRRVMSGVSSVALVGFGVYQIVQGVVG